MDILQTLGINPILLAGYFVNFLIIFFVLNKFVFKKAIKNIEDRKKLTEELVNKNTESEKLLENAKKEFDDAIRKAGNEAQEIVNKANINAGIIAEEIKRKADEQSKEILERAQNEIIKRHSTLKQELEREMGELVLVTINKVITDLPEKEKKVIQEKIDEKFVK